MIGIDAIDFTTSRYFIEMSDLAVARGVPVEKYVDGLHQRQMSVAPPNEDAVTLGYAAASKILDDTSDIGLFIFATESSIDQSKSAGTFLLDVLQLPRSCITYEIKQACFSGTAALFAAYNYVAMNKNKRALVVASDIARYTIHSPGEATQGCGAVAMIISNDPKVLSIDPTYGSYSTNTYDFYRPNCQSEAIVDGALSAKMYLTALKESFKEFSVKSGASISDIDYFCYHTPFCKMAIKAHDNLVGDRTSAMADSLVYNSVIGNSYSASLYISLLSLLHNSQNDISGRRIGMFSYGSGCVGQYFCCKPQKNYFDFIKKSDFIALRERISIKEYEAVHYHNSPKYHETSGSLSLETLTSQRKYVLLSKYSKP